MGGCGFAYDQLEIEPCQSHPAGEQLEKVGSRGVDQFGGPALSAGLVVSVFPLGRLATVGAEHAVTLV